MGTKEHSYKLSVEWKGNTGTGTSNYRSYERDYDISVNDKPPILGSSDPAFRGNPQKYNPEELFIASLSSCHMLWFLHLCADSGIIVTEYIDYPVGLMTEMEDASGKFKEVILNPVVTVTEQSMLDKLDELHQKANKLCFIANSVNFQVHHQASAKLA